MAIRHMKRHSMPIIREMQVKIAMKQYLTWVRMTIIKESTRYKNRILYKKNRIKNNYNVNTMKTSFI